MLLPFRCLLLRRFRPLLWRRIRRGKLPARERQLGLQRRPLPLRTQSQMQRQSPNGLLTTPCLMQPLRLPQNQSRPQNQCLPQNPSRSLSRPHLN